MDADAAGYADVEEPGILRTYLPIVDEILRGAGQVVFCNSPLSGLVVFGALGYGDPVLAVSALFGGTTATLVARFAHFDPSKISDGLYGYNGLLTGCAAAVFFPFIQNDSTLVLDNLAVAFTASSFATLIQPEFARTAPAFTYPFNAATIGAMISLRNAPLTELTIFDSTALSLPPLDLLLAPLVGISQIFLVNDAAAGALLLSAIAWYSPGLAAHTLMGSAIGTATSVLAGVPAEQVAAGLCGFNSALTSLAVGVFFVHSPRTLFLSASGAAASVGLTESLKMLSVMTQCTPVFTLPFCAMISAIHYLPALGVPLRRAASPHSPEKNLPQE